MEGRKEGRKEGSKEGLCYFRGAGGGGGRYGMACIDM